MRLTTLLATSLALVICPLLSAAGLLLKNGDSVAFLGDSITFGGAASPGGYVRLVESGLASQGVKITVIPAGVSGHKSDQMLARLEKDVLAKKPTWMTLSCGVNDVWHGMRGQGVSLEDYKANITAILDRCEKAGVKVLILTATQIKLPVTNPENTKLADYNAFLRDIAKARGLPLADLSADMAAEQAANPARVLTTDGVHMNLFGNLMMAKGVLGAFGLGERELADVRKTWSAQPDLYQTNAKVKLSLNELAALEALAAKKGKSVDALVADLSNAAVKAALADAR